jgi:ribA/ribD-fused uncharacterized protein
MSEVILNFGHLKPYYFWKEKPFTQWTVTSEQFRFIEKVPMYGEKDPYKNVEHVFTSTEQWMMWKKARLFGDYGTADKILNTNNARVIKNLGREVKGFTQERWDKAKLSIVIEGNIRKFGQNEAWKQQLMNVVKNGYYFVEASPFDTVWGIGLSPEDAKADKDWRGENLLGIALTNVAIIFIKKEQQVLYQEDVNYSCVPMCEALKEYLKQFIDVDLFTNMDLIENEFADMVKEFVENHWGRGEFRHHH